MISGVEFILIISVLSCYISIMINISVLIENYKLRKQIREYDIDISKLQVKNGVVMPKRKRNEKNKT